MNVNYEYLFKQLPEAELWTLLQDIIASQVPLADEIITQLDDRMQGLLFLQEYIGNREARIEFARSPAHIPYFRDAAGRRNVWMDDDTFTELVNQDDSVTLACFARSEQMKPHHLAYIEYKLANQPHQHQLLATSYDATIALIKALEQQANTWEMSVFRLAKVTLADAGSGSNQSIRPNIDSRQLWWTYLELKDLGEFELKRLQETASSSSARPVRTSGIVTRSIH